jgi:hypothetical protein
VLEVGNGIDPAHEREAPCLVRNIRNDAKHFRVEDLATLRDDHNHQIIIFGEGFLKLVEGLPVWIFRGKEDASVGIQRPDLVNPGNGQCHQRDCQR